MATSNLKPVERLFVLYNLLTLSKYPVSREKICRELECNRATFFRIKNELSGLCGAEIVYDKDAESYKIETYGGELKPIPGMFFKEEDLLALICFEHITEVLQEGFISGIFKPFREKIESLIKVQRIDTRNWKKRIKIIKIASRKILPNIYKTVASAILHRKKIKIVYQSVKDDSTTERIVSPQTLLCYRDNWYMDAKCHLRNDLRTFALSRISQAELQKSKAENVPEKELIEHYANSYGIFSGPAQNIAKIKFSGIAGRIVEQEEWHPQQKGSKLQDGSYLLELPYSKSDELLMDILRWGEDAEVLDPEKLRNEIEVKIGKMKKVYDGRTI
jgi:predicted DNA-binding transcriptional regulator YafY